MLDEFGFETDLLAGFDPDAAVAAQTALHMFSVVIEQVPCFVQLLSPADRCRLGIASRALHVAVAGQIEPQWLEHESRIRALTLDSALLELQIFDRQLLPASTAAKFTTWPPPNDQTRCMFCLGASAATNAESLTASKSSLCADCTVRAADVVADRFVFPRICHLWDVSARPTASRAGRGSNGERKPGTDICAFVTPAELNGVRYLKLPVHVDMVNGDDVSPGTESHPVQSLDRAAAMVRALDMERRQNPANQSGEPFGGHRIVPAVRADSDLLWWSGWPAIRLKCDRGSGCHFTSCNCPHCNAQLCVAHGDGIGYWLKDDGSEGFQPVSELDYRDYAGVGIRASDFVSFLDWRQKCIYEGCNSWYCMRHAEHAPVCDVCQLSERAASAVGACGGTGQQQLCLAHANKCHRYYRWELGDADDKYCGVTCCPACRHLSSEDCAEHSRHECTVENI
jgi:hypothetical protein